MNVTVEAVQEVHSPSYISHVINTSTALLGTTILVANLFILLLIARLVLTTQGRIDNNNCFLTHLLSVTINDTLCGVMLFVMALISVYDVVTSYFCAYTLFCALALQTASQGNIICVSAQRYVFSRNISQSSLTWQMFHTKTLLIVNIVVAVGTFLTYITGAHVQTDTHKDTHCFLGNVLDQNVANLIRIYFIVGMVFTLFSDILCFLTIRKLKAGVSCGIQPEGSTDNRTGNSQLSQRELLRQTTKARQKRAIITIVLILGFFNLSVLPSFLGFVLTSVGSFNDQNSKRVLMMSMFTNSLINPVIIATRVKDIRTSIFRIFSGVRTYVVNRG